MRWIVSVLCLAVLAMASVPAGSQSDSALRASPKDVVWWQQARFGMFIHWGPVSLKGTEISWSRGSQIPTAEYDSLYKQFNPTKFDARQWVAIAKAAGMKYLVFTTRHHDGFSEFDSKLTDYKITNSPFKRDVVAELAKACHDAGMRLGFYYSPPDWHHPDFHTANHQRFIDYLHGQLAELCSNYGKVDVIWFDGLGGTAKDWDSERLFREIRRQQPHVLINNRAGLQADFDTPEQTIGKFQSDRPWESCITIGDQWAWKPNDRIKPLKECIQTLVRCAGGDGNLLFNVGPMPTGEIEPRQVARLKEMGAWLKRYGKTIYGTRGGPFMPGPWGASTCSGRTVYVHVLKWEADSVRLPAIPRRILNARALTGGKADVRQTAEGISVSVPPSARKELDTIVALQLDGPASTVRPVKAPSSSLAFAKTATCSNVYQNQPEFGAARAFDDDERTRWATGWGTHQAWIQVDLGKSQTFARAVIQEECGERIQEWELQRREGDVWVTFARGTTIVTRKEITFDPVTARVVRLNILRATEGPTISELLLLPTAR